MIKPRMNPQELMHFIKNTKGFDHLMAKVNIVSMKDGNGLAKFTVCKEHTNSSGKLHSGFMSMVSDFVSSYSFSSHELGNNFHVSINTNFVLFNTEADVGDRIEVTTRTLRGGYSLAFLEVWIKNESTGNMLAKCNHNMFCIHPSKIDDHQTKS